jgi:hypothetical protein
MRRRTKCYSENPEGKDHLEDLGVDEIIILNHLKEMKYDVVNWILLALVGCSCSSREHGRAISCLIETWKSIKITIILPSRTTVLENLWSQLGVNYKLHVSALMGRLQALYNLRDLQLGQCYTT